MMAGILVSPFGMAYFQGLWLFVSGSVIFCGGAAAQRCKTNNVSFEPISWSWIAMDDKSRQNLGPLPKEGKKKRQI